MSAMAETLRTRVSLIATVIALGAFLALIAFLASFQHQYELVIHHNQTHWVAPLYPLSDDLLIVAATLVIWYAATQKWGFPWGAYLVLAVGVGASGVANLAADNPGGWTHIGPFISVWPAVAFLGAYEMTVWVIRKQRKETGMGYYEGVRRFWEQQGTATATPEQPITADEPGFTVKDVYRLTLTCGHPYEAPEAPRAGTILKCPDCGKLDKFPGLGV